MKKLLVSMLFLALLLGAGITASAFHAQVSAQNLSVNGQAVQCEKYNIDGSNYFKLRDLAKLLDGTGSQFDVGWDASANVVTITTSHAYTTPNGQELVIGKDNSATAKISAQTIKVDGKVVSDLTVYNIGGSNYFKLREMGDKLGFDVDYNAASNTAIVTSKGEALAPAQPATPDASFSAYDALVRGARQGIKSNGAYRFPYYSSSDSSVVIDSIVYREGSGEVSIERDRTTLGDRYHETVTFDEAMSGKYVISFAREAKEGMTGYINAATFTGKPEDVTVIDWFGSPLNVQSNKQFLAGRAHSLLYFLNENSGSFSSIPNGTDFVRRLGFSVLDLT